MPKTYITYNKYAFLVTIKYAALVEPSVFQSEII